jgi:hypothetical protein
VDRGAHLLAGFFAGANGIDAVADHLQRLERHHRLIVLGKIADDHQQPRVTHLSSFLCDAAGRRGDLRVDDSSGR